MYEMNSSESRSLPSEAARVEHFFSKITVVFKFDLVRVVSTRGATIIYYDIYTYKL